MGPHLLLVGAALAFLVLRAKRAARNPQGTVTVGPIRVIKRPRYELDIGTAREPTDQTPTPGGGGGGAAEPAPGPKPMQVAFFVRVSGFEKLGVDGSDVRTAVANNADVLPGIGRPRVRVRDVSGGYAVNVRYPDSTRLVGSGAARRAIESVDPRLQGRVENVRVARKA